MKSVRKYKSRRKVRKTRRKTMRRRYKQVGGVVPCVPCAAVALSNPIGAGIAAAGACVYGGIKAYKCIKKKLTKSKGKKGKKGTKGKKGKKDKKGKKGMK